MKDIVGLEGRYAVTEDGKVWSHKSQIFLKPCIVGKGYLSVTIPRTSGGKCVRQYIHRIVAREFIANPDGKPCVNHKSGNKTDNSVGNLEWVTYAENSAHAVDTGLSKVIGTDNPQAKLTEADVAEMRHRYLYGPETQDELACAFGVHRGLVKMIVTGERWASTWKPEYARPPRWKDAASRRKRMTYDLPTATLIREKYAAGGYTTRSLAAEFGLHSSGVWKIVANKDWTARIS